MKFSRTKLVKAVESKRMTKTRIAQKAKISQPYLYMLLAGTSRNPSEAIVKRLYTVLSIS